MLGWFLYFWITLSTDLLIFETTCNKSSLTLMLSWLTILLKKAYSFQQSQSHFFREKGFNYFPKFFIVINVFNANVNIMSFFGFSNEFYITTALLMICFFIFIRPTRKKFISQSWSSHYFFVNFFCQKKGLDLP